jgi:signal transduction histidine kinase/CheY-like chemotaxis protein
MPFPQQVIEYLQKNFSTDARPACFQIDSNYRLINSWGDTRWCGLESAVVGSDMLQEAPYLFGLLDTMPLVIDFVSAGESVAHVHTIPDGSSHFVVLLDAKRDHDSIQIQQQAVNELRLLQASQQRLIGRQRDLIGELVEAKPELDHHRKDAERSSNSKGQFIAMMSHEFRTPLASIVNYAELASEADVSENTMRKSIEAIARSAHHLNRLVEAVLDDARLDAGQIELRETDFDLYSLLDDLAAMMAPMAADKALSFVCQIGESVPRLIRADEVRLRQILINLLGNAVKFTDDGGIQLTTTYADGRLVSSVADTGPGISVEDQERVFRAFERGGTTGAEKGAGLGLAISLHLAQLMGGEISLDSTPGRGCTVAVNLPIAVANASTGAQPEVLMAPTEESHAIKAISVLVCDDDEDMLALAEFYLHRAGYGLIVSTNGAEALSKALAYEPDIVLMDCNLPGMTGIETAAKLRHSGYSNPIVALTASKLSEEDKARFTSCFQKPAPMQELLAEIKSLTH